MALIPARVYRVLDTVREAHPLAQALSARLASLVGSDLNGTTGTIRIGEVSAVGGRKVSGYVQSPQSFKGAGTVRPSGAIRAGMNGGLPNSQAPWSEQSPLLDAIARAQNPQYRKAKK
ncbi:hypothetical protein ACFV0D_12515 [Streptomyces sp. NPDC059556]|uniref:hypothetical protein n=1 Tax=Streptomyces sp. NPDC059556 TaxID=3346863 RepID=UPI003697989D